jgi:hypothetical protein
MNKLKRGLADIDSRVGRSEEGKVSLPLPDIEP